MILEFGGGHAEGTVSPPPSKSHTHRAFFVAGMAERQSLISDPLISEDTKATLSAVRFMGADVSVREREIQIKGGHMHPHSGTVDVLNSGTTMRIFAGIASIFDVPVTITGDESIKKRPMGPLLDALGSMGVSCVSRNGFPPVTITGPNRGGDVRIDGSVSSQFVSSIMLAAPMMENGARIHVGGGLVSAPYVRITESIIRKFGGDVSIEGNHIEIGSRRYKANDYSVPADFSSAAFPLVAGALGGRVTATGLDLRDAQGDRAIIDMLKRAGAKVTSSGGSVTSETGDLEAIDVNMGDTPDLFPIVAVLLSTAKGTSRLYGAPHLRFKESDRIESTVRMINSLGGDAVGTEDGCMIRGKARLTGGSIDHRDDHRIMMAAAVASLVCDGPVSMKDTGCHAVSYPGFVEQMVSLGIKVEGK
ncbi:MAG: 3-phosphoshikimate 1-carboxyvinyltransferase [Candidatus Methanomethylophilaceae archaeon]|nr:3-phosphoshikimate 1-carboxyvinyltransferase [Candidatus Methanomethylophilaceae archaeon]